VRGGLRCSFGEGSLSAWVASQGACEAKGGEGGIRCVPHGERDGSDVLTRAQGWWLLVEIGPEGWTPTQQPPELSPPLRPLPLVYYFYLCEERKHET
jgi:hypothetical protein